MKIHGSMKMNVLLVMILGIILGLFTSSSTLKPAKNISEGNISGHLEHLKGRVEK